MNSLRSSLCLYTLMLVWAPILLAADKVKPNVILVFSDDQRYDTIHALGNEAIHTPNLDRLVNEGTSFTRAYMMGSMSPATCIPSRAMLLSGRSLFRLAGKAGYSIPPEHVTIPEALKANGYYTYWVGKSHQDKSTMGRIFDGGDRCYGWHGPYRDYNHYLMAMQDFDPNGRFESPHYIFKKDAQDNEVRTEVNPQTFKEFQQIKDKEAHFFHTSEAFTTGAVNFLNTYKKDQPFFMYLAYHAPHDPRNAPKRFHDMYPPESMKLPVSFKERHPFDFGVYNIRDEELEKYPRTEKAIKKHLSDYYAIISHLDEQLGRVLTALDETGLADNTIVIYSSDSACAVGNHGLMGKQNLYDSGGIHVPLIFRGPGVPKGQRRDALCYLFDVLPTICELTGTSTPKSSDGKSLSGVLNGKGKPPYDYQYFAYTGVQRAVQGERYKLIESVFEEKRHLQLFDLKNDLAEVNNLAGNPDYKETISTLGKKMAELGRAYGDKMSGKFGLQEIE